MPHARLRTVRPLGVFLGLVVLIPAPAAPQVPQLDVGKRAFDINCARCHGIGGTGNTGPSLARPVLPRARDDSAFRKVIESGIPGTEMPGAFWLGELDQVAIVAYVRSLGRVAPEVLGGNAARGATTYQRAGCAGCHVIGGSGGVAGPELTDIGIRRSTRYLRESIVDPAAAFPAEGGYQLFLVVRAVLRDGRTVTGVRINEDNYSIQLRDVNGFLHSLRKDLLRSLVTDPRTSTMPSFRGRLAVADIEDIVAYLATARNDK
jgi:cytochrome c oxidase cbb3-type subunit 3